MEDKRRTFIEVTPTYPLPVPIHKKEDYYSWPVKMMQNNGFDCYVFTLASNNQKLEEDIDGIKVIRFKNTLSFFWNVLKRKPTIVYAQGRPFPPFIGFFSSNAVYTPHGSYGVEYPLYIKNILLRKLTKFVWANFKKVVCITPYELEVYSKFGFKKNYIYIPNGIDYNFFSKVVKNNDFLVKNDLKRTDKIILFIGNIHGRVKNLDVLYKAFQEVNKKIDEAKLVIIGKLLDKDLNTKIIFDEMKKNPKVKILGWLPHIELRKALNVASCFVNTSKNEGHSIAVAEAAASGVPLCLSEIETFKSTYENNALYHNPFDHKKLAENILRLLTEKELAKQMSCKNKELIKDQYQINIVQDKLLKVFQEIWK